MVTGHLEASRGADGRRWYRIRLDYGPDPLSGHRRQPRLPGRYADRRHAVRALAATLQEVNRGPLVVPHKRTVEEALVAWLDQEARISVRPRTLLDYESMVRLHVLPHLGHLSLLSLTSAEVTAYRGRLLAEGCSTSVVKKSVLHLSQALGYAVRCGWLGHNPARGLKRLANPHREMAVWTGAEAAHFLGVAASATYAPLWHLALATGMRWSELRALRWTDVDLEGGRLAVRRSLDRLGGEHAPKNGRARVIELDDTTLAILRAHRARQGAERLRLGPAWADRDLVLATTIGIPLHRTTARLVQTRLTKQAGVPAIRFHDLRHTAATLMLGAGVPVKVVSERLGHASVSITLDIYAHVLPGMQREAARVLERVLATGG